MTLKHVEWYSSLLARSVTLLHFDSSNPVAYS